MRFEYRNCDRFKKQEVCHVDVLEAHILNIGSNLMCSKYRKHIF